MTEVNPKYIGKKRKRDTSNERRERKFRKSLSIQRKVYDDAMEVKKNKEEFIDFFFFLINKYKNKIKGKFHGNVQTKTREEIDANNITKFAEESDVKNDILKRKLVMEFLYSFELLKYDDKIQPQFDKEGIYKGKIKTIKILEEYIEKKFKGYQVDHFGSFRQGLWNTASDLDFLIIKESSKKQKINELLYLNNLLLKDRIAKKSFAITKAKVPIITGICRKTNEIFDISIGDNKIVQISDIIANIVNENKGLKESLLIVKQIMKKFNLINSYYGYLSSYTLFHLVYAFYLLFYRKNKNEHKGNIYLFILKFFEYFGFRYEYQFCKISFSDDRKKCVITTKNFIESDSVVYSKKLSIYDITNNGCDIGSKCFRFDTVRLFFRWIYNKMVKKYGEFNSVLDVLGLMD